MDQSFAVVGAGIIGAAVARELTWRFPDAEVTVYEKEAAPAAHQTGHNSGVVHAGLYYEPGGLKARLCRRGVALLREFCLTKGLPYDECGKVVVALDAAAEQRLRAIHERAVANGVPDVDMIGPAGIRAIEPDAVGRAALHSPHTAIVDYPAITRALLDDVIATGGRVEYGTAVDHVGAAPGHAVLSTSDGYRVHDLVITCAGLQSDRLARRSGGSAAPSIVPFFGQYFALDAGHRDHVRGLVYPVPDPRYPFLGVHLTRRVDGEVLIGPNAFLSLGREHYSGLGLDIHDTAAVLADPGFWRFSRSNLSAAVREIRTILSPARFVQEAARYVPAVADAGVTRLPRGVRAQAMNPDGSLVDDFVIGDRGPVTAVRNAPSPGATSSLAIAEYLVAETCRRHGLRPR